MQWFDYVYLKHPSTIWWCDKELWRLVARWPSVCCCWSRESRQGATRPRRSALYLPQPSFSSLIIRYTQYFYHRQAVVLWRHDSRLLCPRKCCFTVAGRDFIEFQWDYYKTQFVPDMQFDKPMVLAAKRRDRWVRTTTFLFSDMV
jgi:hypothetical protein